MKRSRALLSACLAVAGAAGMAAFPSQATAASLYAVDDGSSENSIGFPAGGDIAWFNAFTVLPGQEVITNIILAWGSVADGTAASVHLWSDPNNDGNPNDAVLLQSQSTTVTSPNTDTFVTVDIPDTTLMVGDTFFVGAFASSPTGFFPAAIDQTTSAGQSWVAGSSIVGSVDLSSLSTASLLGTIDSFGFPGNWLVRAEATAATPTSVPEPAFVTGLLGISAAALLKRKGTRSAST